MQCVRAHQCDHLVVIHTHLSHFLSLSLSLPLSRCLPSCLSPSTRARHAPATHHLTLSVSSVHQHTNGCKTVVLTRFAGGENAAACRSQSSSRAGSPPLIAGPGILFALASLQNPCGHESEQHDESEQHSDRATTAVPKHQAWQSAQTSRKGGPKMTSEMVQNDVRYGPK